MNMSEYPAVEEFIKYLNREYEKRANKVPPAIYDYDDVVSFEIGGNIYTGKIAVVDRYGTFEQDEEPSYDIFVGDNGNEILYKHIRQSWIVKEDQNG